MPPSVASPVPTDASCQGCSRRALLRGLAFTAATTLVGCAADPDGDGPPIGGAVSMCGANLCLDLDDPANAMLTMIGGALTVRTSAASILIVRTSDTAVQALSGVCTHAGCGVGYDRVGQIITCPCHGSRFSLTGAVIRGPATRPLALYATELDAGTNVLAIALP
jgi:Rieske Fe-S protein